VTSISSGSYSNREVVSVIKSPPATERTENLCQGIGTPSIDPTVGKGSYSQPLMFSYRPCSNSKHFFAIMQAKVSVRSADHPSNARGDSSGALSPAPGRS
jgi:hypothetical protein